MILTVSVSTSVYVHINTYTHQLYMYRLVPVLFTPVQLCITLKFFGKIFICLVILNLKVKALLSMLIQCYSTLALRCQLQCSLYINCINFYVLNCNNCYVVTCIYACTTWPQTQVIRFTCTCTLCSSQANHY